MIKFDDVTCRFRHSDGKEVMGLNKVATTIPDGQFVCLLGRSGHGKSTFVRALAGLQPLSAGQILVDGKAISGPGYDRGMVFQEDTIFPWLSVEANVAFGLRARGVATADCSRRVQHWLAAVGLTEFARSWPKQLSGGMRKRVAIATVFANDAPVLLMDEPFGPLDYVTRRDLQDLLIGLWRETGKTIVFVTHDIEEALLLAERILMVRNGQIVDDITLDLPRPRDEEVRASRHAVKVTRAIQQHLALDTGSRVQSAHGQQT